MSPRPVSAAHTSSGVRRRGARTGAVLVALLALTACGSGQQAQTYQTKAVADATNDAIGSLAIRNLAVVAPREGVVHEAGSDVPLLLTVVNEGGEPDVLREATTEAAASVEVAAGPTDDLRVERLATSDAEYRLVLRDLTEELATGQYISLTLSFERNGTKELLVPVQTVPEQFAVDDGTYEVIETDSNGDPLVEAEPEGGEAEGGEARPETDTDGGEEPEGDAVPESGADTGGDQGTDTPPSE